MNTIIQALSWRYATKQYNPDESLSENDVSTICESIRLAPTSFGLQPFTVVHVKNKELRQSLRNVAWNQSQITDASDLLVFTVPLDVTSEHVEVFIALIAKTRNVTRESLEPYQKMIQGTLDALTPEKRCDWAKRQAYLALGMALETAALIHVDATPMEGFDAQAFDELLDLKSKKLTSVVILALGKRSPDDQYAEYAKVRKDQHDLFITY